MAAPAPWARVEIRPSEMAVYTSPRRTGQREAKNDPASARANTPRHLNFVLRLITER